MFRSFQIIIKEFRRSLLKLLHIHDLVRFCKQSVVAAYHVVWARCASYATTQHTTHTQPTALSTTDSYTT